MLVRRHSGRTLALAGAAVLVAGTTLAQGVSASATGASASAAASSSKVIVVMRDQLSSTPATRRGMPARTARAVATQDAVLARLSGPRPTALHHFALANAFSAKVTAAQAAALRADPTVARVVADAAIPVSPPGTTLSGPAGSSPHTAAHAASTPAADPPFSVCPSDPAQPIIEPEALRTIHAISTTGSPGAQDLTTGVGVKVAYIADGIDPNNPDFIRPDGSHAIIDYQDFSGDGPNAPSGGGEAFGDASSIAAQGTVTYDLSNFVNAAYPLPPGCNIKVLGVAPGASIVALKAGGEFLTNSSILQSIDYAVRVDHVDVINESFGLNEFPDDSNRSTVQLFNDAAVAAGVTITESTGDGGVTGTIGSDAQDPKVISAAASTDSQLYNQTGYAASRAFGNGQWANDEISALSSSGFTQKGRVPDVVAPGESDWAACEASASFASCTNFNGGRSDIEAFGGTSQSSPLTAGVAALVISAYRSSHNGASPTPALVKRFITSTATDLGMPPYEQGSGRIDARAAVEAALTYHGSTGAPSGVASNIVTSTDQLTLTGNPGSSHSRSFTVTNAGNKKLTVTAGTRGFRTQDSNTQTVAFDSSTLPTFPYPTTGAPWAYKKVTFNVPAGTDRLLTQTAWPGGKALRLSLFAPDGTYVANSRPQGASPNYANLDVRSPASGTWTAVFYSPAAGGFVGNASFAVTNQDATSFGSVIPSSFTLKAGASRLVTVNAKLPKTASGDASYAVTLASSGGHQTVVSEIVRALIPAGGSYSGVVTGGNARNVTPGQTASYEFRVPAHKKSLYVSTVFAHNPGSVMDIVLTDPNGELSDVASNLILNEAGDTLSLTKRMQSFTAHPVPGLWRMTVVVQNPVSGADISQPFTGQVNFRQVPVKTGGLPDSTKHVIKRGKTKTFQVKVTNPGVQPILVGVDPRLTKTVTLTANAIQGQQTFALPPDPAQEPTYNAPPDTSRLTVAASSSTPAQLELQGSAAGFDLFGDLASAQNGNLVSVTKVSESGAGNYISKGIWFTNMQEIGPFTDAGAPTGTSTLSASLRTWAFDHDVTTSTDDPYGNAVDPANNGFGTPVQIAPHSSRTITVTITPSAPTGRKVRGVLNIVTVPNLPSGFGSLPFTTTGEVVATVPYAYQVG